MSTVDTSLKDRLPALAFVGKAQRHIRAELRRMLVDIATDFARPGTRMYEIGCESSVLGDVHACVDPNIMLCGFEKSSTIVEALRSDLAPAAEQRCIDVMQFDPNRGAIVRDASVVTMVEVLNRLGARERIRLLADVYRGLLPGGALLVVEHTLGRSSLLNNIFASHGSWADRAARGSSDPQVPYFFSDALRLLNDAGFSCVELFFRWYDLCAWIALK